MTFHLQVDDIHQNRKAIPVQIPILRWEEIYSPFEMVS